jgi:hypothetical protein
MASTMLPLCYIHIVRQAGTTVNIHQENWKALVGLATRPNQSQTRANKTRPDQQDDQTARGPLCLKPEVAHNVAFIINSHLNDQIFPTRTTRPDQSTRAFRFADALKQAHHCSRRESFGVGRDDVLRNYKGEPERTLETGVEGIKPVGSAPEE